MIGTLVPLTMLASWRTATVNVVTDAGETWESSCRIARDRAIRDRLASSHPAIRAPTD